MIAAPTYSYVRQLAPSSSAPVQPTTPSYAQPFAPFLASIEVASRRVSAARTLLAGPQLMHQSLGEIIKSSVAQASEGIAALDVALAYPAPASAVSFARQARAELDNIVSLSMRASTTLLPTTTMIGAFTRALHSLDNAREQATLATTYLP